MAYTPCFSQFVAIWSYSTVSPELAGNRNTKSKRRHNPKTNAVLGLEKIRFIEETHLTIESDWVTRFEVIGRFPQVAYE